MTASRSLRRIVTGHDESGKAIVVFDDDVPNKVMRPETGIVANWVWISASTPADITLAADTSSERRGLNPPPGGSIFRIVDFPPTAGGEENLDHHAISSSLGLDQSSSKRRPATHPLMHFTETLDYAIVMSGEIDMMLDDSTVHLKAGDVIVQQATNHAWINRGTEPCRIAFVLIDAKPL
ncbi:MAG: cupin domain protein [Rhodospirillales bacterium]|nr:cupin domain protein [Rhodospirillales bacterium]